MVNTIADTSSCIPVDQAGKSGIPYLPQLIIFGDKTYRENTEISQVSVLHGGLEERDGILAYDLSELLSIQKVPNNHLPPDILVQIGQGCLSVG
jgi:fatty acid-binding protein DegV